MGHWADHHQTTPDAGDDGAGFEAPLGDLMRGERATKGKSLLDVERDLKIKAAYIAAIENADVSAFTTKGFIAGYVRSYARYLGMDPDTTFARFSAEAGFDGVHGTGVRPSAQRNLTQRPAGLPASDALAASRINLAPASQGMFAQIGPGALGSTLVVVLLLGGIGYGAWAVLTDIQRVQFAPVESEPETMAQLDPVTPDGPASMMLEPPDAPDTALPQGDGNGVDRMYRPRPLDVPILTPRDRAIATLEPGSPETYGPLPAARGASAPPGDADRDDLAEQIAAEVAVAGGTFAASGEAAGAEAGGDGTGVQVTARPPEDVVVFAVEPAWVRVRSAGGTTLFERVLEPGESYTLPVSEAAPTLRTGNAGGVFFMVGGAAMGPAGARGAVTDGIALSAEAINADFAVADLDAAPAIVQYVELVRSGEATELNPDAAPQ